MKSTAAKLALKTSTAIPVERAVFKINELCRVFGISEETLRRWHNLGIDPPGRFKVGTARNAIVFYDRQSVENWMKDNIKAASKPTTRAVA